jgi:hypothetical protein
MLHVNPFVQELSACCDVQETNISMRAALGRLLNSRHLHLMFSVLAITLDHEYT